MFYYPFNIDEYNTKTKCLTKIECCIYIELQNYYIRFEKPFDNNLERICRYVNANNEEEKQAVKYILDEHYTLDLESNKYYNDEIEKIILAYNKKSQNAKQAVNARWSKQKKVQTKKKKAPVSFSNCQKPNVHGGVLTQSNQFDEFWEKYPKKQAKTNAKKAYNQAIKKVKHVVIMLGLDEYIKKKPSWQTYALPATWLNNERWKDVYDNNDNKQQSENDNWGKNALNAFN